MDLVISVVIIQVRQGTSEGTDHQDIVESLAAYTSKANASNERHHKETAIGGESRLIKMTNSRDTTQVRKMLNKGVHTSSLL